MDAFNFVFSLFGLLLGLALAEVLGGFGTAMDSRRELRIGWLTPSVQETPSWQRTLTCSSWWRASKHMPRPVATGGVAI